MRAKKAHGWGEWSQPSAVLRATSTGGAQYAASALIDGSFVEEERDLTEVDALGELARICGSCA